MCLLKIVQKRQYRLKTITRDETSLQVILQHALFFFHGNSLRLILHCSLYKNSRKCKTLKMGRMAIHVIEERVITVEMLVFGLFS